MKTVITLPELHSAREELSGPVGLVPTMGYLHPGHLSLVRWARAECQSVVVSIFVNPTQFGPNEDLDAYPRDIPRDLALLEDEGVDLVWMPSVEVMYPPGFQSWVTVEKVTQPLEGKYRPGHFRGVATVVAKLFTGVQPDKAYFGQKDAQQAIVIRRLVQDLNFPIDIDREVQVLYQAADNDSLLGIFLTEIGLVRLNTSKQFGYHGGHTSKMTRPVFSLKRLGDLFHGHPRLEAWRIHHFNARHPDQVNAFVFKQSQIPGNIPGICIQVFVRAKLSGIDKDAYNNALAFSAGPAHEGEMPRVQISHSWNQSYRSREFFPRGMQFWQSNYCFHGIDI